MFRSIIAPHLYLLALGRSGRPGRSPRHAPGRGRLLLFVSDAFLALRPANAVAVVLLFGRATSSGASRGRTPWGMGLTLVVISTPDGQPLHSPGRMRPRKIQSTMI